MGHWMQLVFGNARSWARDLAVAACCGLFLGVLGPFGSYLNPSRVSVIAYWIGVMLLGEAMIGATRRAAMVLAARLAVRPIVLIAPATAVMAIPLSLLCHAVAMRLWPRAIGSIGPLTWYGQTLLVCTLMAAGHGLAARTRTRAPAPGPPAEHARKAGGNFLTRLPPHIGADLIALQMEDHYVRAHTARGSALVLIPLRQAMDELDGVPGLRVHRSWWVARHAVVDSVRDGRNMRLRLVGGLVAPVSRAHVAAVRAAGLQ